MKINWKLRLQSKSFWVAVFALIGFVLGEFGVYDAGSYQTLVDALLLVLVAGGIVVDTSTPGVSDTPHTLQKDDIKEVK